MQNKKLFDYICSNCKRKLHFLEKYGVENPAQLQSVKDKIKKTNIEKYGTPVAAKNSSIKAKMKHTLKEKYNNILPGQKASHDKFLKDRLQECDEANLIWLDSDSFKGKYENGPILYHFKCKICGNEFIDNFHSLPFPICRVCHPNWHNTSKAEKEIVENIKKIYNGPVLENDRKILEGKELDIYLPEKNIAIEYNGTYWHGYRKDLNIPLDEFLQKHEEKRLLCESKGIHLITIDEIDYNEETLKFVLDIVSGNDTSAFRKKYWNDLRYFQGTKTIECTCRGLLHKKIVNIKDFNSFIEKGGIAIFNLGFAS